MDAIKEAISEWLREILLSGTMSNLTGLFDSVNEEVADIAAQVGKTPAAWNSSIYSMIHTLSENVIVPIAGLILAFVMTLEFIQMIIERNNFHDFDIQGIYKWMFKTACAVLIVTNTWNIVMAVFDVSQNIVNDASGIIVGSTTLDFDTLIPDLETRLEALELGELLGLWIQSFLVGFCMKALSICIFIITFGRMIEIYLVTSVAPIPMATMMNRESGHMGQNYLKSLGALGLQAFLIIICVAIYAALVQNISVTGDISYAIWTCMGYTVLLCFSLFKTGSLSKGILGAH
ncbi:MAG: VirB6/TrbL-like conjugal transfer protein, CD1112 family [Eubacteriales bacterium]